MTFAEPNLAGGQEPVPLMTAANVAPEPAAAAERVEPELQPRHGK